MRETYAKNPLRQRFRPLAWLGVCFVVVSFIERLILLLLTGSGVPRDGLAWLYAFGMGLVYDLVTFVYFAWPLVLFLWLVPSRSGRQSARLRWLRYAFAVVALCAVCLGFLRWHYDANWKTAWPALLPFAFVLPFAAFTYASRTGQWVLRLLCLLLLLILLFASVADITFWNEFSTRFNFIAVDYLVYTTEVLGNIRESYPVVRWIFLLVASAVAIVWLTRRHLRTAGDSSRFGQRSLVVLAWLGLTLATAFGIDADMKDMSRNMYVNSLAGNGIYQFFAAYRNEDLDFHRFYKELPDATAYAIVRRAMQTPDSEFVSSDAHDLTRMVRNPGAEQHLNVVLITVESLSASYLGVFGNARGLTPFLDDLSQHSLFFDHAFANGTRTVRGLEAVTLSVPPTPGNSLIRQKHNEDLFSLGKVFRQHDYVPVFAYGGFGEFDNMNAFFADNGYVNIDRRDIPADSTIHSANVWGVADEDLYTLAMAKMDTIHAAGKPFFMHVMTTSNHRPYTWPPGRVDMPQGKRDGAVKYTDWAIGDFIRRMRSKPYFDDTLFVITADHCANSAGTTRIPLNRYHIPLFIYAPAHVQARVEHRLVSQIDIAPTLLGLLHFNYRSRFFGYNVLDLAPGQERAFPSTYANLGYYHGGRLSILMPKRQSMQVDADPKTGAAVPFAETDARLLDQAIAYYQVAYDEFDSGRMRWRSADATPVAKAPDIPVPAAPTTVPPSITAQP